MRKLKIFPWRSGLSPSLGTCPRLTNCCRKGPVTHIRLTFPSVSTPPLSLDSIRGGAGALTESSASVFAKLSPATQADVLEMYFGKNGHGYTLARTHIGSCDFALSPYTYQKQSGDFNMTTFSMARDKSLLIPFIQRVKATIATANRTMRLVSSPWTPPPWLKTCGDQYCPLICGLKDETTESPYRSAYALYLSKCVGGWQPNRLFQSTLNVFRYYYLCVHTMVYVGVCAR